MLGRGFALTARYLPPPPPGVAPPTLWGDPNVVRQRLGDLVTDLRFYRATMWVPSLSPAHTRANSERGAGPMIKVIETLAATDPAALDTFRREYDAILADYFENNFVRQDYLISRAIKG